MRMKRLMCAGLLALAAAGGILGANQYFQRLAETEGPYGTEPPNPSNPGWPPAELSSNASSGEQEVWAPGLVPNDFGPRHQQAEPRLRYFPHRTQAIEMAQADGRNGKPATADKPPYQSEPAPLPMPHEAAPLTRPQSGNWLRKLIAQELPQAPPEEQRVWSEELRGLSPEMVRDILRMRKDITAGPQPPALNETFPPLPDWSEPPANLDPARQTLPPLPQDDLAAGVHSVTNRLEPSLRAVEQARDVVLNNLANANTIGFKRSRVVLEALPYQTLQAGRSEDEAAGPGTSMGSGVVLSGTPIDASQGPLKKTNQPLDVAIDGPGFFRIEVGSGVFYTRCGQWSFSDKGELCLASGGKLRPLAPRSWCPRIRSR